MTSCPVSDLLATLCGRPVAADGGMGTQLLAAGLTTGENSATWNVSHPGDVQAVHTRYADAGCQILTTNSFQGTRSALMLHALDGQVVELNRAAAALAREVADDAAHRHGHPVWVAGDVGPFGGFLEPLGDTTLEALHDLFAEQMRALQAGGADFALIETMSDPAEVEVAIRAAKSVASWPVAATYAFQASGDHFTTMMGTSVEQAIQQAIQAGADIVGANCGTALDLEAYRQLGQQLVAAASGTPVLLQPNAGAPRVDGDQTVYDATPEAMADLAASLVADGVHIVGGCCGTTPAHLTAMTAAIRA